ncbi:MAG: hypothetical protein ACJ72H_16015 [Candidatus Sulfotelmatobacter sp.]
MKASQEEMEFVFSNADFPFSAAVGHSGKTLGTVMPGMLIPAAFVVELESGEPA